MRTPLAAAAILSTLVTTGCFIPFLPSGPSTDRSSEAEADTPDLVEDTAEETPEPDGEDIEPDPEPEEDLPGIGDPVESGDFEFTLTEHDTAESAEGSRDTFTPQGEYVVLTLTVTNQANQPEFTEPGGIKLYDEGGREYNYDSDATIALSDGVHEQLNPDESGEFTMVYDLPDDADPAFITVASDRFSDTTPGAISLE